MTRTLLGDGPIPSKPLGDVAQVEARYAELFEQRWRCKAALKPYGKHRKLLREMIDNYGLAEVLALVEEFFTTTDPVVTRKNYTVVDFYVTAQYLRLNDKRGREIDPRSAANIAAARRAIKS